MSFLSFSNFFVNCVSAITKDQDENKKGKGGKGKITYYSIRKTTIEKVKKALVPLDR